MFVYAVNCSCVRLPGKIGIGQENCKRWISSHDYMLDVKWAICLWDFNHFSSTFLDNMDQACWSSSPHFRRVPAADTTSNLPVAPANKWSLKLSCYANSSEQQKILWHMSRPPVLWSSEDGQIRRDKLRFPCTVFQRENWQETIKFLCEWAAVVPDRKWKQGP